MLTTVIPALGGIMVVAGVALIAKAFLNAVRFTHDPNAEGRVLCSGRSRRLRFRGNLPMYVLTLDREHAEVTVFQPFGRKTMSLSRSDIEVVRSGTTVSCIRHAPTETVLIPRRYGPGDHLIR